jgi:hypothetical protein
MLSSKASLDFDFDFFLLGPTLILMGVVKQAGDG